MDETHAHLTGAGQYDCAPEPLPTLRHSTAHLLAQAVTQLFPGVKLAIGPPIENGFYYDFHRDVPFTEEDLARLEERMRDLAKADYPIVREERSRADAIRHYRERGEPFKVEILEALPADVTRVSFYRQGEFVDLCRGPHVPSTGHIQAFKLMSSSGAYWRGDEHRPMLQRIYGTAWFTQEELDQYVWSIEEAKRRDHRKLGRELDLFMFHDVSPGAPFWLPKGMVVFRELERYARELQDARGLPGDLHADPREQAAVGAVGALGALLGEHVQGGGRGADLQPQAHELPGVDVRVPARAALLPGPARSGSRRWGASTGTSAPARSPACSGCGRSRWTTRTSTAARTSSRRRSPACSSSCGCSTGRSGSSRASAWPRGRRSTSGPAEQWDQAERALEEALRGNGLPFTLKPGDGAFYGPKIDIHIEDILGRDWQMATVQADLTMLPERFQLEFVDSDGRPKRPVAIHRAILGSFERFIGILIEHFAGAFPAWLAPVQARVLPVSAKHAEYAGTVHRRLLDAGVRAELDDRSEKLGYRVREAQVQKVPYVVVVGEREAREGTASVRKRGGEDVGAMPVDRFLAEVTAEIRARAVTSRIGPERG